jgi:ADP-ribosyl-[dinitrogen reductase] hydrolase
MVEVERHAEDAASAAPERGRFRGALLGLAVGDALGAPAEFMTADQVRERWGVLDEMVGGGCHRVEPGEGTDATEMTLCLAESLAANDGFAPDDVVRRYHEWFLAGPRDVSLTTRTVMLALSAGTPWDLASRRAYEILGFPTAGNGSIMRCSPIALRYRDDPDERRRASVSESALTHFDHLAGRACAAYNDLVAAGAGRLREHPPPITASYDDEDLRVAEVLRDAAEAEPEEVECAAFVLDSLRAALWAVLRCDSFEETLVEIVNRGNDSDTVAAITGALAGALYGDAAIPQRWLAALHQRDRIVAVADALAARAGA